MANAKPFQSHACHSPRLVVAYLKTILAEVWCAGSVELHTEFAFTVSALNSKRAGHHGCTVCVCAACATVMCRC